MLLSPGHTLETHKGRPAEALVLRTSARRARTRSPKPLRPEALNTHESYREASVPTLRQVSPYMRPKLGFNKRRRLRVQGFRFLRAWGQGFVLGLHGCILPGAGGSLVRNDWGYSYLLLMRCLYLQPPESKPVSNAS